MHRETITQLFAQVNAVKEGIDAMQENETRAPGRGGQAHPHRYVGPNSGLRRITPSCSARAD